MPQLATMMSRTCTAVAWCAVAALLVSAATAARLDLWPTSSGPLNEGNHSRTHVASLERIGCGPGCHCNAASTASKRFALRCSASGQQ